LTAGYFDTVALGQMADAEHAVCEAVKETELSTWIAAPHFNTSGRWRM